MFTVTNPISLDKSTIESPNLCPLLTETDLAAISDEVNSSYEADCRSREQWERRTSAAMDLALQVQKEKNFPWPNCSNVAFPLITIAALQFHSRAYPALVQAPDIVQCRVVGSDPDGGKAERAERVGTYMSYQVLEQDSCWETEEDRALINVPIVGTAWKKSYYDSDKGYIVSELVLAKDLIINYWAKDVNTCSCKTQVIPLTKNQVYSRCVSGIFLDVREEEWYMEGAPQPTETTQQVEEDNRTGLHRSLPDSSTPFIFLEQHCFLDLDGDGYAEPVIVTMEQSTKQIVRIVYRFNREEDVIRNDAGEVVRIHSTEFFTKIPFIPSPDGGIMDIGFGVLLGPLNESVDTAINQIFDAGTIANTAGGFLGRGAKIRGGVYQFSPFEWNRVDSTGDDLKKSVLPLPVREPSQVLFSLLSLLITYTEKVSGAVDISTGGNPGQNTPAQTSQTMVEQGQKVYAAIFKRVWKSLKEEFKKLYLLNGQYMPEGKVSFAGSTDQISREDFLGDPSAIVPVADPNILSDQQIFMQGQVLMGVAKNNPLYNQDAVNVKFLKGLKISNIDQIYLGTKRAGQPQPTEKVQIELLKAQVQLKELELKKLQFISSLMEQRRLNEAKIVSLYAQAALFEEQAGGVQAAADIQAFQAKIDALKVLNDGIDQQIQAAGVMRNANTGNNAETSGSAAGGVPAVEGTSSNGTGNAMVAGTPPGVDGAVG